VEFLFSGARRWGAVFGCCGVRGYRARDASPALTTRAWNCARDASVFHFSRRRASASPGLLLCRALILVLRFSPNRYTCLLLYGRRGSGRS
jgi:hypothetical protein